MEQGIKNCIFQLPSKEVCQQQRYENYEYCLPHLEYLTEFNVEIIMSKVIPEKLGVEAAEVKRNSRFSDDLGADSLDMVELAATFEEAFKIKIPDKDMEGIRTLEDAITYLTNKLLKGEPKPIYITDPVVNLVTISQRIQQNTENIRRLVNQIIQSKLFQDYSSHLDLQAANVEQVFNLVIRNNWIDHVTTVPEFDEKTEKLSAVNYIILCKKVLYDFRLEVKSVRFTSYSLADLKLSYQVRYSADNEISEIVVSGGSRRDRGLDEETFTFKTKEGIKGALGFLNKYLSNMEALK